MPIFKIGLSLALFFLKYNTFKIGIINAGLRIFDQIKMHNRLDSSIKRLNF